ncbi:uncharacterized protein LOC116852197 isoform X3 [Odontomachus brunneus]|nr:uncharacterized protein LOC116852197 isoform X3 [Odontomachus brunneus]
MPPDPPTWDNYDVEVEGVYATVQLARKKAENSNCTSSEESVSRGKGKRRKRKKVLISDDESSENCESDRYERPPPFISKENINKHQNIATLSASHDKVKDNVPLSSSTTNISDGQVLYIDLPRKENNKNIWNTSVSENNIGIESNSMHVQSAFQTEIPVLHTEVASSNETPVTSVTSNLYSQKQQKILEQCTLIKMYVRSIDSRLKRIEDGRVKNNNNVYEEMQIIQNISFKDN